MEKRSKEKATFKHEPDKLRTEIKPGVALLAFAY